MFVIVCFLTMNELYGLISSKHLKKKKYFNCLQKLVLKFWDFKSLNLLHVFQVFSQENANDLSSPPPNTAPSSWTSTGSHHDNLMQLEPALTLLIQTMADSATDRQSVSFAQKLADLTLNFLYCLLKDVVHLTETTKLKGNKDVSTCTCIYHGFN